jgi:hypothetical protein
MRGTLVHRRPLPSLVEMAMTPASATRKFAPEIPISAAKNASRNLRRATAIKSRGSSLAIAGIQFLAKQLGDLATIEMHGGSDNVVRRFLAQLHDELAQIGFPDLNARLSPEPG